MGLQRGEIQNGYHQAMGYLGPDGLKHMGLAVWPEFHKPLKQYAADRQLTMTHVIVVAVDRRLKRADYWPVLTAEAKERRQCRRFKRIVQGGGRAQN